ncbi:MAG: bifunctional phosphopantothenoylcysteine decarboxylase/phosphopantothenate--cysteine ligase CoaBC [Thermoleophilaceae bacterium]|nr:bifunctional phosphopantothenoylcysteine decarboxylase/phosphopantothenate--cysteine ligase CoaBC [Thermoleophilaceae bacterium]
MARILLGVSGGIAAYKALELTRLAIKAGHSVRVVQTPDSERFVGKASFEGITGAPVMISQFDRDPLGGVFPDQSRPSHDPISHLELAANCDVFVVAPATANTIAKLAAGMADNMLTTLALGCSKPLVVAPAMNNEMYLNAATQANVGTLRDRGVLVIEPQVGELASKGEYGVGRLVEPAEILQRVEAVLESSTQRGSFAPRSLDGLRVLITAGGTREPIDSVRFVGNRSSGKMGFALAAEAAARGAHVTVIAANVSLDRDTRVEYIDVQTAAELEAAANTSFVNSDVLVMAAAVADFRPTQAASEKIKKAGRDSMELTLTATNDILSGLAGQRKDGQLLVGFAAETGPEMLIEAERKRVAKGLDLVVANDVGNAEIGFEVDQNAVALVAGDSEVQHVARASKAEIAAAILDRVELLLVASGAQRSSKPSA